MSSEDQLYQEIENYLKGNLTADGKTAFEQRLAADAGLQNKVALSKLANTLVIENRLLEVKQALGDVHNNPGKPNTWKKIILGITGVLLVGNAALFIFNSKEKTISTQNTAKQTVENISTPAPLSAPEINNSSETSLGKGKTNIANKPTITNPPSSENVIVEERKATTDSLPTASVQSSVPIKPEPEIKEIIPVAPVQPAAVASPCMSIHIKAKTVTVNPCEGEENGSISISDIKNGYAPYSLQLKDKSGTEVHSYYNLKAGNYSANITDSKGCIQEIKNIILSEKRCSKDYAFNPFTGEVWNIPISENSGTLIIHDKAGDLYLQKELNAGTQESWDGYSQQGELKAGYFIYTINYKNGTLVSGSVSIVK